MTASGYLVCRPCLAKNPAILNGLTAGRRQGIAWLAHRSMRPALPLHLPKYRLARWQSTGEHASSQEQSSPEVDSSHGESRSYAGLYFLDEAFSSGASKPGGSQNSRQSRRPPGPVERFLGNSPSRASHFPAGSSYQTEKPFVSFSPGEVVLIDFNGEPQTKYSAIALRDACSCSRCVDPSTKQKLLSTTDIPSNIKASSVEVDGNVVRLVWENDVPGFEGHVTEIPVGHFSVDPFMRMSLPPRVAWEGANYADLVEDIDFGSYMQDDRVLLDALRTLHTHGLLFLKNVPEDQDSVATIAKRIGPLKNTFYGETWDVRSVPDAKNVAYTNQNLGFHMDLLYMEQPPHLQFLHCIRNSSTGGASLFSDTFGAAARLHQQDLAAFERLLATRLRFHYPHSPNHMYSGNATVVEMKHSWYRESGQRKKLIDSIRNIWWSPPFQAPFRPTYYIQAWHAAARKFEALLQAEDAVHERLMKPGECVIFDNRRVVHARKTFDVAPAGSERWLRGAYLDWDPYFSRFSTLTDRFAP